MSELKNQMELSDFMPKKAEAMPEGYDEDGKLINPAMSTGEGDGGAAAEGAGDDGGALGDVARTPEIIAAEINAIKRQAMSVAISAALAIGEKLIEARGMVPRGRWGEWLAANVEYSERKAQDLMRFYEGYGDALPEAIARLDYTKALQLLALPEGEREDMAEKAAELSTRELEAEIRRLRADHESAQRTIFDLSQTNEDLTRRYEVAERAIRDERDAADRARAKAEAAEASAKDMRKVSGKAAEDAARAAQSASDAVNRANALQTRLNELEAQNRELEAQNRELEARTPEPTVVQMPDDEAQRQIDALRAELDAVKAGGGPEAEADRRRLAMALQVRLNAKDCAATLQAAIDAATARLPKIQAALDALRGLDATRAEAVEAEVKALEALVAGCREAAGME